MNIRQGLYADPMVYDILYSPNTALEVATYEKLEALFAAAPLNPRRVWFEPACGTGRFLRVAARRGRQVVGFDLDDGQIEYAKKRGVITTGRQSRIHFFQADMRNFLAAAAAAGHPAGSADFALNPVNSIRHLASDREMLDHFDQMARILKPRGVYIVGLSLTDYDWLMPEEDLWESARGRCKVSQLINFLPPEPGTGRARIETAISHLTVTRPSGEEHYDDRYDLRTYDRRQWRNLVAKSGLRHAGSFDAWGKDLGDRTLPYQLEVLISRNRP
jgi:SAM-dependent methyltransferase